MSFGFLAFPVFRRVCTTSVLQQQLLFTGRNRLVFKIKATYTIMAQPASKKQRTQPQYELLYHPGIPGRGEHIRLAFEAAGVPYSDIAMEQDDGYSKVQEICMNKGTESADGNPPIFAPPGLRVPGAGKGGGNLIISQTPNILLYIGERIGMAGPDDDYSKYYVNQIALTALDLNNEVHDSHHPIAVSKYYEEQVEESKARSKDIRENRFPKFFSYFERTLKGNKEGQGKYLVGSEITYADTTVWQLLDGCIYAFPKEMEARKKEFPDLFGKFHDNLKEEKGLKEYLSSERRMSYSMGIFRKYPELDRQ